MCLFLRCQDSENSGSQRDGLCKICTWHSFVPHVHVFLEGEYEQTWMKCIQIQAPQSKTVLFGVLCRTDSSVRTSALRNAQLRFFMFDFHLALIF